MQWLRDRVGSGSVHEGEGKGNFMVGSHKWTGSSQENNGITNANNDATDHPLASPAAPKGSFRNPEVADSAVQAYDAQQHNPYVQHGLGSKKGGSFSRRASESNRSGNYPKIYESSEHGGGAAAAAEAKNGGSGSDDEEEVLTGAQVLVTIPGAIVHLIDEEESVHLATGDFTLMRYFQDKTKVVTIAKVGSELQWPLVQEEPTVKLDPTHYFFTLKVPSDIDDDDAPRKAQKHSLQPDASSSMDVLNYGVTFPAGSDDEEHAARIRELDYFLERYSLFSAPTLVQGEGGQEGSEQAEAVVKLPPQDPNFPGKIVPEEVVAADGKVVVSEENSQAFWTTIAPNVDDYNHKMAKGIAVGAGQIIRGIFWLSDSTVASLDAGHDYMRSKFKPKKKESKISPLTMGSVRRVRKITAMTDRVAAGVLGGILYTTGLVTTAVVTSPPGKSFFKFLPGEVALVSLDAFGRVFDAIEKAGTDVMTRSSSVTQEFVNYRYGESAKELTDESLRTVGHVASTAWTVTKIRKALNPNKGLKVSKSSVAKSLAKSAVRSVSGIKKG